jgi:hypothetical protein
MIEKMAFFISKNLWALVPLTVEKEKECSPTKEQSPKIRARASAPNAAVQRPKKIVSYTTPVIDCLYQAVAIYLFSDQ